MKANWFVALPVKAGTWFEELISDLPESCRPFDSSDLHLTLAFLGAMDAARVADVKAAMSEIEAEKIVASFDQFISLPSTKRMSAMTLALDEGHDQVVELMRQHKLPLLEAGGAPADHREPLPHMTFARPIRKFGAEGRQDALAWLAQKAVPKVQMELERVALYTWSDQRPQVQFRVVHEKKLTNL